MKELNKAKVFEYYYYLLCFINLYIDNQRNVQFIDEKLMGFVKKMTDIAVENKFSDFDKKYQDLFLDLESVVVTKTGFDNIIIEYKDFIESFSS